MMKISSLIPRTIKDRANLVINRAKELAPSQLVISAALTVHQFCPELWPAAVLRTINSTQSLLETLNEVFDGDGYNSMLVMSHTVQHLAKTVDLLASEFLDAVRFFQEHGGERLVALTINLIIVSIIVQQIAFLFNRENDSIQRRRFQLWP